MTLLSLYQVWCITQQKYQNVWSTVIPTISSIDGGSIANYFILKTIDIGDIVSVTSGNSPYTLDTSIGFDSNSSGDNIILNLPPVTGNEGKIYHIFKTSGLNTVTVIPNGSDTIDGDSSRILTFNGQILTIACTDSIWTDDYSLIAPQNFSQPIGSIESVGPGASLYYQRLSSSIQLKSLQSATSNLTITDANDTVNFSVSQPICLEISGTSAASIGTTINYAIITGMSLTPPAGTYLVSFSSAISIDSSNKIVGISIYFNGAIVQHSERIGSIQRNNIVPVQTQAKITVNGSQTVSARWKTDGGTLSMSNRSLSLLQVSP